MWKGFVRITLKHFSTDFMFSLKASITTTSSTTITTYCRRLLSPDEVKILVNYNTFYFQFPLSSNRLFNYYNFVPQRTCLPRGIFHPHQEEYMPLSMPMRCVIWKNRKKKSYSLNRKLGKKSDGKKAEWTSNRLKTKKRASFISISRTFFHLIEPLYDMAVENVMGKESEKDGGWVRRR